jgi:hypothetical protein
MKELISLVAFGLSAFAQTVTSSREIEELSAVRVQLSTALMQVDNAGGRLKVIRVRVGDNLQAAINDAKPGDTLMLDAGGTWTGNFKLPAKRGDGWVTITSSNADRLPAHKRVSPAEAPKMARIVAPNVVAAFSTESKAHHYRLVGLEITAASGVHSYGLVQVSAGAETVNDDLPHHIEIDRSYIHADSKFGGKRGIATNARHFIVTNSYLADFKSDGQDAQGICCWQCSNGRIANNYIEGSGENVFFAEMSTIKDLRPTDILVERNHLKKPLAWKSELSPAGRKWVIKNSFEIKAGSRIIVRGNVFENSWVSGQQGTLISLKAGADPRVNASRTEDVLFENNIVTGGLLGLQISGYEPNNQHASYQPGPGVLKNITVRNNVFHNLGGLPWGTVARSISMAQSPSANVTIENNTILGSNISNVIVSDGKPSPGFVFKNNLLTHGTYGIKGPKLATGTATLKVSFPEAVFTDNVFIHSKALLAQYPASTRFVNAVTFAADGYTQTELEGVGADAAVVSAATAGVVQ